MELCAIIDMDGHRVNKTFQVKELAIIDAATEQTRSFHFWHGSLLNDQDRRTVRYVEKNIFNIPYDAYWPGVLRPAALDDIVQQLVQNIDNPVIGYKGGHVEKDLLWNLDIPSFNLEYIGCPSMKVLEPIGADCGKHPPSTLHCPVQEIRAFHRFVAPTLNFKSSNLHNINVDHHRILEEAWD